MYNTSVKTKQEDVDLVISTINSVSSQNESVEKQLLASQGVVFDMWAEVQELRSILDKQIY